MSWPAIRNVMPCTWVAALALLGCGPPETPLAALTQPRLHVSLGPFATGEPGLLAISVTSDDHGACITLDPDTEILVNGKSFSLGSPSPMDDGCAENALVLDLVEDHLEQRSPAQIVVRDSSLTMRTSVPNLFGERTIRGPVSVYSCGSGTLSYDAPASDVVVLASTEIGFSSAEPSASAYQVSSSLVFATFASSVSGKFIHFDVPNVSAGEPHGPGTLVVDARAEIPVESCVGASSCDAAVDTHAQLAASLGDGCSGR